MIEKHVRSDNKPERKEDAQGWRRSTRITYNELEILKLNFSRCTNRDIDDNDNKDACPFFFFFADFYSLLCSFLLRCPCHGS